MTRSQPTHAPEPGRDKLMSPLGWVGELEGDFKLEAPDWSNTNEPLALPAPS